MLCLSHISLKRPLGTWNKRMYVRTYVCMQVCVYACMHVCMHACMHVNDLLLQQLIWLEIVIIP